MGKTKLSKDEQLRALMSALPPIEESIASMDAATARLEELKKDRTLAAGELRRKAQDAMKSVSITVVDGQPLYNNKGKNNEK